MLSDKEVFDKITNCNNRLLKNWYRILCDNKDIKEWFDNRFSDKKPITKEDYKEIFLRVKHKIHTYPMCPICGNFAKNIFSETCGSKECHNELKYQRQCKTNIKKYGCANQLSRKEVIEHLNSKEIWDKRNTTMMNKYGVLNPSNIIEVQEKRKKTFQYKYGVDNPIQVKEFKEKAKQKIYNKYGVNCVLSLAEFHEKSNSPEAKQKEYLTKKKNGTLGKSQEEDKIFEMLKTKYPNVIHHYRDNEKYPFNCDFYIPEIDTWIEYQGLWTHGEHPFNKNLDKEKLELLKEKAKTSDYYKGAIETWTMRDPLKRKIAKKNGLNYLEFFNMKEFLKWFDNLN